MSRGQHPHGTTVGTLTLGAIAFALALVWAGCKGEAPPPPAPAAPVAPPPKARAVEPAQPTAPSAPPVAEPAPQATPRPANHPGEPANPAQLRGVVERYFDKVGGTPNGWNDLIQHKIIGNIPIGKNGRPLDYMQYRQWAAENP